MAQKRMELLRGRGVRQDVKRNFHFAWVAIAVFAGLTLQPVLAQQPAAQQPAAQQPAAGAFEAHEWGVWMVDRRRLSPPRDLAAECPFFVQRTRHVPRARVPRIRRGPVTVEKPVLFFHATAPVDVEVRVRFRAGQPWLLWPRAQVRGSRVSWTGRIVPSNASGPDRRPGHRHAWWPHLRAAGGDSFVPSDGSPAEDFIFYDGVQQFTSPFRFRMSEGHDRVLARSNETRVFISRGGQLYKHEANRDGTGAVMQLGPLGTRIEPALRSELRALGLTEGETHSLLRTWHDELHRTDVARAFYLISRERYDRMLPLRITPAPTRTVRAGLVIETL